MKIFLMKINVNAYTLENSLHIFSSASGKPTPRKFPPNSPLMNSPLENPHPENSHLERMNEYPGVVVVGLYQTLHERYGSIK